MSIAGNILRYMSYSCIRRGFSWILLQMCKVCISILFSSERSNQKRQMPLTDFAGCITTPLIGRHFKVDCE